MVKANLMEYDPTLEIFKSVISEETSYTSPFTTETKIQAIKHVEKSYPHKYEELLTRLLDTENDYEILRYILNALGQIATKQVVDSLTEFLFRNITLNPSNEDQMIKVKHDTIKALGNIRDPGAVLPLMYVLNDKTVNYRIRLAAAEALGKIGDMYALQPLISLATDEKEKSIYVRESAVKALGMLGDIRAAEPLMNVFFSKKGIINKFTFFRERIIETLRRIGHKNDKTLKVLSDALKDEAPSIRLSAVISLGEMNDEPKVIELLEEMLQDRDEDVCRAAVMSLYNIKGDEYLENILKRNNMQDIVMDEAKEILEEG